jgi:2,5-diketo-D-gluconate reductase A
MNALVNCSPGGIFGQEERTFDDVKSILKAHLTRLQTTYVDLYLLHHAFAKSRRIEQYRALLALQEEGLIRSIGVSNWSKLHIEEIKAQGLPLPAVNQIEVHPLCTQRDLIAYLQQNNIVVVAYSSLAPLSSWRVAENQLSGKTEGDAQPNIVQSLSSKYGKSDAQLLLRWALQQEIAVIPKVLSLLSLSVCLSVCLSLTHTHTL